MLPWQHGVQPRPQHRPAHPRLSTDMSRVVPGREGGQCGDGGDGGGGGYRGDGGDKSEVERVASSVDGR